MADINTGVLGQANPMEVAGMPKQMGSYDNPGTALTPAQAAMIQAQYQGYQTQENIAKGQLGFNLLQYQNTVAQQKVTNQLNAQKFGLDAANYTLNAAKTGVDITTANLTNQQKMLENSKQTALMQAAQMGPDAVEQTYQLYDPEKYQTIQKTKADIGTAIMGQGKTLQDMSKEQMDMATSKYQALGAVAQNIKLAALGSTAAGQKAWSAALPYIQTYDPNAGTTLDMNRVDGYLMGTGGYLKQLQEQGATNAITTATAPSGVPQGAVVAQQQAAAGQIPGSVPPNPLQQQQPPFAGQGQPQQGQQAQGQQPNPNPNAPVLTPGIMDLKTGNIPRDINNINAGVIKGAGFPETASRGAVGAAVNPAKDLINARNDLLNAIHQAGSSVPYSAVLNNAFLQGSPALQQIHDTRDRYNNAVVGMYGPDAKDEVIGPTDSKQSLFAKLHAHTVDANNRFKTAGDTNAIADNVAITGFYHDDGSPISEQELTDTATKNHTTVGNIAAALEKAGMDNPHQQGKK